MLYITFQEPEKFIYNVDIWFNNRAEAAWLEDPFIKEFVEDVDRSKILSPYCIQSPVLGQIPPSSLSGGVKALMIMYKTDRIVYGTACGNNCSKWVVEIGKKKDVTIYLEHVMKFPDSFEAVCFDNGKQIHSDLDFRRCFLECFEF